MATQVRKQFLLDPELLKRARKALGTRTDTETVERALRSVSVDEQLRAVHADFVNSGVEIVDVYGRLEG